MTQILSSPVDPATTALLVDSLPVPPAASTVEIARRRLSALELVAALRPRDPVEAAMAVRVVAAHHGVMDSFRCAAQAELSAHLMIQHQGRAVALSRLMDQTMTALERRQMRPALRVAVMPEVEGVMEAAPGVAGPVVASPVVAGPVVASPVVASPMVARPVETEAAKAARTTAAVASAPAAQPAAAMPVAAKPLAAKPAAAKPGAPLPAASAPARAANPDGALTAQQEQALREIALRAETSTVALAA